jgi:hypothetical protein
MTDQLKELLESEVLGPEVKTALQEAFDNKIKLAEAQLQETYAARYAHDKAVLVEAMDRLMQDSIKKELNEFQIDRTAVSKQRAKLAEETVKIKTEMKQQIHENNKKFMDFATAQLRKEIVEFQKDRRAALTERKRLAREVQQLKESNNAKLAERINKLESFVLKQLSEEITEFQVDKKALVEQRVQLAKLGKKKIQESQQKLINRSVALLDKTLNEVIKNELVQWRDDIKSARENNFGRRIFESFVAEYMSSYLSEGSELKKLKLQLEENRKQLKTAQSHVQEKTRLAESAKKLIQEANDRAKRLETLTELTGPLSREKRAIMLEMLEDVKNNNLKEAFNRYLPTVLNNGNAPSVASKQRELVENAQRNVAITGNRATLAETVQPTETAQNSEIGQILYLAGITNKEVMEK